MMSPVKLIATTYFPGPVQWFPSIHASIPDVCVVSVRPNTRDGHCDLRLVRTGRKVIQNIAIFMRSDTHLLFFFLLGRCLAMPCDCTVIRFVFLSA